MLLALRCPKGIRVRGVKREASEALSPMRAGHSGTAPATVSEKRRQIT
jgi:hypothetical protein